MKFSKLILPVLAIASFFWFISIFLVNSAKADEMEDLFDTLENNIESVFDDREAKLESLWSRMEAEEEAKWKRLEQEVLQKWDSYSQPTQKVWVDYSEDKNAVSKVDFESGKVVVEVLVLKSEADPVKAGKELISRKIEEMQKKESKDGKPVMQDMLSEDTVKKAIKPIPAETLKTVKKKKTKIGLGIGITVDPKPVKGKDGIERVKVRTEFPLVPDHLKKRAKRYIGLVREYAGKYGLEVALILAVIQTESYFNPEARSHIPAFGLMQLVPRFAAKEAYLQIHGKEKVLSAKYLYNPQNNIELGVTHLSRLHKVYFKGVVDPENRRFIAVSAYNWGPTVMRRKIVSKEDINNMTPDELFDLLQKRVPEETKNYLKKIEKRRKLWREM